MLWSTVSKTTSFTGSTAVISLYLIFTISFQRYVPFGSFKRADRATATLFRDDIFCPINVLLEVKQEHCAKMLLRTHSWKLIRWRFCIAFGRYIVCLNFFKVVLYHWLVSLQLNIKQCAGCDSRFLLKLQRLIRIIDKRISRLYSLNRQVKLVC